ncbi:hypothetical protein A8H40_08245 [Burkholderia multivorans]|uniref:Uncharacterized protein n=2 Tax=Burkholderia multivorans TaxID=87883 RepID=B9BJ70_9BURK|nr:hypothetical protein A8H40_08245 [Burkholderia multivorans]EEE09753.1 hypothetical protein BURMUCGD2_5126 [Burkholderia multivorans CGD2]EEE15676.1 hypothetical protein BURMUCGD2M_5119 [Burkholderia multivorans CGD2M]EJO56320.1 hypothetical protein BURMUCF1_A1118 [Burkholderia multivorans ATCC BAA-247]PRD87204.1 hypothetical protein C6P76_13530 [Burkholderia multivorans]
MGRRCVRRRCIGRRRVVRRCAGCRHIRRHGFGRALRAGGAAGADGVRLAVRGKTGAGGDEQQDERRVHEHPPVGRSDGGALLFRIVGHGVSSLRDDHVDRIPGDTSRRLPCGRD